MTIAREATRMMSEHSAEDRRSIVVVGDDPLMMRALDRLLRRAGYDVGTEESTFDEAADAAGVGSGNLPTLTIVDLPDDWSRRHRSGFVPIQKPKRVYSPVLWIGAESDDVA